MTYTDATDFEGLLSPGEWIRLKRCNAAHLLDLKRANCSPKFCELRVGRHDRIVALPQRRPCPGRSKPSPIVQPLLLRKRP